MLCHKWELRFEDFLIILVTIEPLLVLFEYVPYGDESRTERHVL